jgi:hypothetical protein
MRDKNTDLWKPRNPLTEQKHRREVLWQITIPIVVTSLIILGLCGSAAALSTPAASRWADISIIWMIPPAMIATLLFAAVNIAFIYLLIRILAEAPAFFFKVQNFLRRLQLQLASITDKAVEPVLKVNGWNASARAAKRSAERVIKRS